MSLKLQQESPSDNDLFEGESHKKVSERMAEVLREVDNNIVGLEGELGSGKSTIINLLKGELGNEYRFIEFDAERYHYGNTKKALIEVIYKGLSDGAGVDQNRLDAYRNQALGNIVEYEKNVKSRLSWWTVMFILCSLLAVQMIRYLLIDISTLMMTDKAVSKLVLSLEALGFLSPAILLFVLFVLRVFSPKPRDKDNPEPGDKGPPTIGDLFKRNSTDTISEKWMVNREVGTIELHDALSGFTDKNTLPHNLRFILIIDNLDRIVPEKVKELWSDMELIAGTTHEHFRIIIPYSARQVASSLEMEGYSGREFIAKRIPVTFSVPPLITAGWQDAFKTMWSQTVSESDEASCAEVIQLLERWRPLQYPRITPRLLKKLVNDIYILNLTVPVVSSEEPSRFVLIALYILMVRYGDHDIRTLLRDPFQGELNEFESPAPDDQSDKLKANYAQLKRIFSNDANRWSEYLMSVHYQAPADLARSELIDTPLIDTVKAKDPIALERLITIWGFTHAWHRCAFRMDMSEWLETAVDLPSGMLNLVQPQITYALKQLNTSYAIQSREIFSPSLNVTLLSLIRFGSISIEPFMERQRDFIISELNDLQSAPKDSDVNVTELFREADQYSQIFGSSLFDSMDVEMHGEVYARYLLNNEDRWKGLNIPDLELDYDQTENMLLTVLEEPGEDVFNPGVLRFIGTASLAAHNIIKNGQDTLQNISKLTSNFTGRVVIDKLIDFRKLIFTKEWNSSSQLHLFAYQTTMEQNYPVEFSAHIVAHMVATGIFTGIEDYSDYIEDDEYTELLANYFKCSKNWNDIAKSLSNDKVVPFVKGAIQRLFAEDKLERLDPIQYVKEDYPLLSAHITGVDLMAPVVTRQQYLNNNLSLKEVELIGGETLQAMLRTEALLGTSEKLYSLSESLLAVDRLSSSFKSISSNNQLILLHMKSLGRKIHLSPDVNGFAEWYRSVSGEELEQGKYIRFIWDLLGEEQQQEILAQLHDVLLEVQVSQSNRVKLIHDFGDVINFIEPERGGSRRGIGALFTLAEKDPLLRDWLDRQKYALSNWPDAESLSVSLYIIEHQSLFPGICKSSKFIENRIKETEQLLENTEQVPED
ncbi:KAP family NTPase [Xenorhabdus bovienii]|uniref:P-loop NTPase fold protein n=1 Tax=Xenorhabdus bovienii TaxID=40576 RepID=UPI0023B246B4|nr:P-loop NTPase fold protein [Xenorhabdus bovienii]MDE9566231.1 KAP family NTPase [Xenorhabdus bovienii]